MPINDYLFRNPKSRDILRTLLDPSRPGPPEWSPADLRAMLLHQMKSPLTAELDNLARLSAVPRSVASEIIETSGFTCFGDLLGAPDPLPEALKMVKNFAKASLSGKGDLPRDVARVLYVLAVLRGRRIAPGRVSTLDDATIEREARRCLTFGWVPEDIRRMITLYMDDE